LNYWFVIARRALHYLNTRAAKSSLSTARRVEARCGPETSHLVRTKNSNGGEQK
jgi:hypothetical protein